jgi:hypothetical protein
MRRFPKPSVYRHCQSWISSDMAAENAAKRCDISKGGFALAMAAAPEPLPAQ